MFKERRLDPRERLALPLKLVGGSTAVTRDISGGGMYFLVDGTHTLSGRVDFEMQMPEISLRFTSSGEIVRIEYQGGATGVAVRFVDPRLGLMTAATQGGADGCPRIAEAKGGERPRSAAAQRFRRGSE